jgi:hypothetical protein
MIPQDCAGGRPKDKQGVESFFSAALKVPDLPAASVRRLLRLMNQ